MTAKDVARRVLDALLVRRDATLVAGLVETPAAVSLLDQAYRRALELGSLEDWRWTLDSALAEGERVFVRSTVVGRAAGARPEAGASSTSYTLLDEFVVRGDRVHRARLATLAPGVRDVEPAAHPTEPVLAVAEIQGNVVPGFSKDHEALLFLTLTDVASAKSWLAGLAPSLATTEEVLEFNRFFSAARRRRGFEGTVRATWTNVAVAHGLLRRLSPDAATFGDVAFRSGMAARADLLGDAAAPATPADGNGWLAGASERSVDAVVIVASDDEDDLEDEVGRLAAGLAGFDVIDRLDGNTLPPPLAGHEHFGFADGISQPGLRGRVSELPRDFLTPRRNPDDPNEGMPGQRLVWPGEFIFGYPEQDPADSLRPGPTAVGGPAWAANGSLLVVRRYIQNPVRLEAFLDRAAGELSADRASTANLSPDALAAKLVGRWRSGAPLMRSPAADDPLLAADPCAVNHFAFKSATMPIAGGRDGCADDVFRQAPADPEGLRCPHAAHIRKVYPRDDVGPLVQRHRLLRRGIPFGPASGPGERGLLFLAYQSSIERQFEFVIRGWVNEPAFPAPGTGQDPIIGRPGGGSRFFGLPVRASDGSVTTAPIELPAAWTVLSGGGYFFAPSVSGLLALTR